jgi:hypothetical protein
MQKAFNFLFFILFPFLVFSQNTSWKIEGKIIEKTKAAVPFANVYVNNTSIGTTTDINGFFTLTIPSRIQKIDLVVSFVGYVTLKKNFVRNDPKLKNLTLILQNGVELNEVKVIAKHDRDWKRKWKIFQRGLFGESDFYKDCQILNPEVVKLESDKSKKVIATANEPIIIQNDAFGLKITFQMEKFESDGEKTYYAGYKFFENLDSVSSSQQKKWTRNKKRAYNDSFRNFLVLLAQHKLKKNGFAIFKVLKYKEMYYGRTSVANEILNGALAECTEEEICTYDSDNNQYYLYSDTPLMVFVTNTYTPIRVYADYPNPYSLISLVNKFAGFTANGWLSRPNGILIQGYWGHEGFSNMLPEDYFPEHFQEQDSTVVSNELSANEIKTITPKTFKTDSIAFRADTITFNSTVQGVIYDKTNKVSEEKKEFAIVSNDINVKISESDGNLSIFDLLRRIPGLMVINVLGQYQIHFRSTNTNLGGGGGSITPALVYNGTFMDDEETVMNILNSLNVQDIKELGAVKYGNSAAFGSRGANGTIVIVTKK